jgi:glutamyl-tRNA reductase
MTNREVRQFLAILEASIPANSLFVLHLLVTIAKLLGPGRAKAVVAKSLLVKQQLLVINRSRRRAPNLSAHDRCLFGFCLLFLDPRRIQRAAVVIQP